MSRKRVRFDENHTMDPETGELKYDKLEGFNMTNNKALRNVLCRDKEIWGRPRAVLDYLLSHVDSQGKNEVWVEHRLMARWMGLTEPQVSKYVHTLINKKLIVQGKKLGRHIPYKFAEELFRKGNPKTKKQRFNEEVEAQLEALRRHAREIRKTAKENNPVGLH